MAEGMKKVGPIATVMEDMIFGDPSDLAGDQSTATNGIPGYPSGTGGTIPEVTFVNQGAFTAPKPASKG